MMNPLPGLLHQDPSLAEPIKDATALAASLAAISVAIFIVLPTFHSIIRLQGAPGFSEFVAGRRVLRGLHALAFASGLFSASVVLGVPGRHFPCKLVLYGQEGMTTLATLLFFVAIYVVWRSSVRSFNDQANGSG
ncbi:hypothetical protein [Micromonospora ureilytica]|uniref:hypothetical protein n=1 Tax=Micromonospora ureilytica TaxID=709868 RepID=UPI004039EBE3